MKRTVILIVLGALWLNVIGQAPYKLSYQAVIRDSGGDLVAGRQVGMRITILAGTLPGTVVYQETQTPTTNANGLVAVEIGGGAGFNTIDWGNGMHYLKTETDPSGGTTYTITGTNQLLSVPYALYAKDVQNKNDADADATNEIQTISLSGTVLTLSKNGGTVTLPSSGGGDNWGTQSVVTNLTLTGNGTTATPLGIVQSQLLPAWTNITGKPSTLSGYGITDGMNTSHAANSITSTMVTNWNAAFSWGNHTGLYKPLSYIPSWSEITGIPSGFADGTDNVDDADADKTNEIQTITLSGTVLTLSKNGGTVTLPSSGGGDNWGTQSVITDLTLTGNGTTATPLGVVQSQLKPVWANITGKPSTLSGYGITDGMNTSHVANSITSTMVTNWNAAFSWGNHTGLYKPLSYIPSWSEITGIPSGFADGTDNVDDADNSPTNELQTLTLTGNTLGISNGNSVTLPASSGDNWGSQVVLTDATLSGNGTTGSPLKLAQQSAASGQVLKWSGTLWAPANDETGSGGTTPTGPAGGDLTGSYPDPLVGDGKITSAKILDGTIEAADLAVNAVTSVKITDGAVTSADLADYSVTSAKIDDGTIATADIANNAISSAKILDGTIATADLAASAVTTDKLSTGAVTSDKLSASAVTADKITTGAVTGTKIAQAGATLGQTLKWFGSTWAPANDETGSSGTTPTGPAGGDLTGSYPDPLVGDGKITSAKILDGAIATTDLAIDAVTSAKIADGAITSIDLADNAVTSVKIADGTIASADLADNAVTSAKVTDGTIATADLAASAVTTDKIIAGAVTGSRIAQGGATTGQVIKWNGSTWAPANDETGSGGTTPTGPAGGDLTGSYPDPLVGDGKITSAKILDGTITTADLADNAVTSAKIADGSIATGDLATSTVTTEKIADHAVAVSKLPPGAAPDNFLRGDGSWAIPTVGGVTEFDPTWSGPANLDSDIGRIGDVGIGTVTPTAHLHVSGEGYGRGNVLFEGEYKTWNPGDPPVEGAGTRMMWCPDRAVFRMGAVSDDRWDTANLGDFSTAIGYNCVASGSVALSIGSYTTASNTCSVAIGHGAQSTAYAATALGYSTLASGYATTAMGDNTVAQSYVSTALGQYNVGSGSKSSWEETEPIFEIGIGRTHTARKNAMTVLKNGYVGIGTITPEASLHVAGDGWPGSFVYLEAAAGNDAGIRFYESTTPKWHIFNDASVGGLMIQNNATTPAIYCNQSNAYVGIRNSSPTQALDVSGNARFRSIASTGYSNALNIQSDGTLTTATSDGRLKENVRTLQNSLDKVMQLRGVSFTWKNNPEYGTRIGFVAQEFEKVIPELVFTNPVDDYMGVNYAEVSAVLVEAVKELKAENDILKARLEKLEKLLESFAKK